MIIVDNKFNIGDTVYLITDPEQLPRIVTRIMVSTSEIMYSISCSTSNTEHWEFEMAAEPDYSKV